MNTTKLANKLAIAVVSVLSFGGSAAWSAPSDPTTCVQIPQPRHR